MYQPRLFVISVLAGAVLCTPLAAAAEVKVETVERVKVFPFKCATKSKVRFTIGTKNSGGVRSALWYQTDSPNGDGEKVDKEITRIELNGAKADQIIGPFLMPDGNCKLSLCPGWGGIVVHVRVEVAEPRPEGGYKPFEKKLEGRVKFTSESG